MSARQPFEVMNVSEDNFCLWHSSTVFSPMARQDEHRHGDIGTRRKAVYQTGSTNGSISTGRKYAESDYDHMTIYGHII